MHVCFPLPPIERYSPASGGAIATCVMQVARGLIDLGHEVTILADNHGDEPYQVGRFVPIRCPLGDDLPMWRRGVSKLRYRLHGYDWPRHDVYLNAVHRAIRSARIEPDIFVVENDLHAPAWLKRRFSSSRQVLWLHNEQGSRHPDVQRLLSSVDRIVTNSGYIRRYTQQRYGLAEERFRVVHNGVDLAAFKPRPAFDHPLYPVKVLFLGRIDPNKGVDLAVDAVAMLRDEGLPVQMSVVGARWFFDHSQDGHDPYFTSLQQKMERANADYLGHVRRPDVPALVREHDVACVLSRSQEPFGLVVLEAMASGCAVIASDRGGLPEACGGAAKIVYVEALDQIVNALRELVTDPDALATAKRASVQRAARAGWDQAAAEFDSVLREVCGGKQTTTNQAIPEVLSTKATLA